MGCKSPLKRVNETFAFNCAKKKKLVANFNKWKNTQAIFSKGFYLNAFCYCVSSACGILHLMEITQSNYLS